MPSARLQQQFIRLWQCCEGKSQDTTLNELAALLSCSRRHMRTLLNTMQDRGWLTWEAEVGRGKRSRLTFLYTGLALQQQRAEDLLEQDRIDQLVQLVGDKATVRQMLVSHLGRSFRQGRHIPVSYTHLDVYKRQRMCVSSLRGKRYRRGGRIPESRRSLPYSYLYCYLPNAHRHQAAQHPGRGDRTRYLYGETRP